MCKLKIKPSHNDSRIDRTSGFKLHAVDFAGSIPAVSQNNSNASRFIFRFVVTYLLVVLTLAQVITDDGNIYT